MLKHVMATALMYPIEVEGTRAQGWHCISRRMLPLVLDLPLGCKDSSKSRQISKQQQPASMLSLTLSRKRSFPTKSLISGALFYQGMKGLLPHAAMLEVFHIEFARRKW